MYAYDFEYDGKLLSDFGFIMCHFDSGSGSSTADAGSEISFTTAPAHSGKRFYKVGTEYKKCLSTTFQIMKNPETNKSGDEIITADEFRGLSRWLNRREYLWFHAFDWCDPEVFRPWVRASFHLTRIDVGNETVGVELEMETDSPFGYGDEITSEIEFTSQNLEKTFYDRNDEIGDCYPELTITCGQSGTLTLEDDVTGCACTIENCVSGEVITLSGETMIISTSNAVHANTLANDFNFDFFRFGNTLDNRENVFTASMPCTVVLKYRPIQKDTI